GVGLAVGESGEGGGGAGHGLHRRGAALQVDLVGGGRHRGRPGERRLAVPGGGREVGGGHRGQLLGRRRLRRAVHGAGDRAQPVLVLRLHREGVGGAVGQAADDRRGVGGGGGRGGRPVHVDLVGRGSEGVVPDQGHLVVARHRLQAGGGRRRGGDGQRGRHLRGGRAQARGVAGAHGEVVGQ